MKNIKFNTQICTTIEQSKKLLELGLKPETADCYNREEEWDYSCWIGKPLLHNDIPAWSLHRLIAMLPFKTDLNSDTSRRLRILPSTDNNFIVIYKEYKVMEELSLYDSIISIIEKVIKDGYFKKEYLKEK